MIRYSSAPKKSNPSLAAMVENIGTKEKFVVSTIRNTYGVFETMVVKAPNLFIASLKAIFSRVVFVVNSSTLQEAQQSHIETAELFEQLNPEELIKKYKIEGRIGMQLFVSEEARKQSRKKPKVSTEKWARAVLDQLFSEKWNNVQKELYACMKGYLSGVQIPEQLFIAEILGVHLELLAFVSNHINFNLGVVVTILFQEYLKKLPPTSQERAKEAYGYCNKKIAEYDKKGLSAYDALANVCVERLGLEAYSDFTRMFVVNLEDLGKIWRNDAKQYNFEENG